MQLKTRFKTCSTIEGVYCLSVCSLRFILTFLNGVSSELSAGDLKRDVEKWEMIMMVIMMMMAMMVMVRRIRNLTVSQENQRAFGSAK